MKYRPLNVAGAYEFTPQSFPDERGVFVSPYQEEAFVAALGHKLFPVAQTNHSRSRRGVLRGIHFTLTPPGTAKYVYCASGSAIDIIVDIRVGSPTFGKWDSAVLDPLDFRAMYFPPGVGHAFLALEDDTVMSYMISSPYVAAHELAIDPLDPDIGLEFPSDLTLIQSERDSVAPTLAQAAELGLLPEYRVSQAIGDTFR
ncbi:dTDP-4-dehydrorhamnose 3,5-epimerase [Planobispora rosea]|uniref:dTDP-4-dehydrorhamnose 3,5-epimerase n=1 Tax=Planobispora rosea TaxID=35762 RepID=A0A8J3S1Q8_PLARO|nr:dTDP-4-dehydrorhamnose 3,5-epimerase family protein [Planobispora rosea]GGS59389.1 dTDP-4-dehydrorhamnose 3,5-epimerase [Planobispora rosea]GIH84625.1 dTDP-4-dehydrorhamnose 3,5-epimerase [Planobispora rosea]